MSQDIIQSLKIYHTSLREKLSQRPEYKAMIIIEKTINELLQFNFDQSLENNQKNDNSLTNGKDNFNKQSSIKNFSEKSKILLKNIPEIESINN
jgi:hypothetical protein